MKKIKIFIYGLILCTLCSSCTDTDKENKIPSNSMELIDITIESETYYTAVGHDGIYFYLGKNILYKDIETSETIVLCDQSACLHTDETCSSYMPYNIEQLFINPEKNKLFYVYRENIERTILTLGMMDLDGSNNEILLTTNELENRLSNIIFDNESFYVLLEEYSENSINYKLEKVNYKNKKINTIFKTERQIKIATAYDSKIIFLETLSGDIYSFSNKSVNYQLFSYDIFTEEEEIVGEYTAKTNDQKNVVFVKNNILVEIEKKEDYKGIVKRTDLRTKESKVIQEDFPFYGLLYQYNMIYAIDDCIAITMSEGLAVHEDEYIAGTYILDVNTGEYKKSTLEFLGMEILDYSSASELKMPTDFDGYFYSHNPVKIVGEFKDNFIIIPAISAKAFVKINGEIFENNTHYLDAVLEYVPKTDFYNNVENYTRFR